MYQAFFQDSLNIGEVDVLCKLAEEIGLNKAEFRQALETRKYREKHQKALKQARDAGIHAAPTFVIGDTVIKGMAYREDFEAAIEREQNKLQQKQEVKGLSCDAEGCD